MYKEHYSGLSSEQKIQQGSVFFLALNSQYSAQTTGNTDPQLISEWTVFEQIAALNKNRYYYYYCIDIKDYVFQKKDSSSKLLYLELPKYLCLKTYIPNFKSFERLLEELDSLILSHRLTFLKQHKQLTPEALTALNTWMTSLEQAGNSDTISERVFELHGTEVTGPIPEKLSIGPGKKEFFVGVPGCPVEFVEALSVAEQVLEGFSVEEVLLCFFCLVNEISLVFVGTSQRQISSAMYDCHLP